MESNLDLSRPVHRLSPAGQKPRPRPRRNRSGGPVIRRAILLILVASALVGGFLPARALAQPQLDNRLQLELERTDRIIERAREQIGVSLNSRTEPLLDKATQIQHQAWEEFFNGHPRIAAIRTMEARDLARRALESAEIDVKAHESIRDLIESTRDLIDKATSLVTDRGDPQARKLLDGGIWQLDRAQDAYRDQDYRKAIRLAASARDLVQRAIQRARGDAPGASPSIEVALDRTDSLIEELRTGLAGNDSPGGAGARKLLDEAVDLQSRARQLQLSQRPAPALRMTTQSRQAALDGLLLLAKNPSRDEVQRALEIVDQLTADLAPEIQASDSKDARTLLETARQNQIEAAAQLSRGEFAGAIESARIAEGLLRRAAEAAGSR